MNATIIRLSGAAILGVSIAFPATGVLAHGGENSTCADSGLPGVEVHGDHVISAYVKGPDGQVGHGDGAAVPGGPGAGGHFTDEGLPPGASFCNIKAHPNGFNTPANVPVPGNRD